MDIGTGTYPGLYECKVAQQKKFHMLWDFRQVNITAFKYKSTPDLFGEKEMCFIVFYSQKGPIQNRETKRCLEVAMDEDGYYKLVLQKCTGQSWKIQNLIKDQWKTAGPRRQDGKWAIIAQKPHLMSEKDLAWLLVFGVSLHFALDDLDPQDHWEEVIFI